MGAHRRAIIDKVKARPDITMPDLAAWLEALLASEKERCDVKAARREWQERRQPARLVFIAETSVKTNMTPLRGRSPRGKRLRAKAPFGKWRTQTFVAGLRCHQLVAPWIIQGAVDGTAFDT